jgi:copper resistance protein B
MDASRVHSLVLFDQLEAWDARPGSGQAWRAQAWIGGDIQRLWLRSEGERIDGDSERAELEILYGRAVSPWWTVLVGIRHDVDPGTAQDFAAIGIMGTAPYKFDVAATAYVGSGGQAALRLEGEYALLLTQRLVLQPHLEINAFAREDAAHGVGSGLGTVETGLRLRYQVTPRIAPYIGIVREQAFGGTADLRRAAGEDAGDTRVVAGLWFWF